LEIDTNSTLVALVIFRDLVEIFLEVVSKQRELESAATLEGSMTLPPGTAEATHERHHMPAKAGLRRIPGVLESFGYGFQGDGVRRGLNGGLGPASAQAEGNE
jgi:hypothetical protein